MSHPMLIRFRDIVPSCLSLSNTMSRDDLIKMVNVAFKIVGYEPINLEKSVDSVIENPENLGIDLPKNQGSLESISLGSSIIENPKNLGDLFYEIWVVDV